MAEKASTGNTVSSGDVDHGRGSDTEVKESEDDSGVGQERSGSGSCSEEETHTSEGQYEVEKVLDYVKDQTGHMYLVKWKDWESDFNTWEPPQNLRNCETEMIRFYNERKATVEDILSQSEYVTTSNGRKRRKGPPLHIELPPDPRPIQIRAQEFYQFTQVPTQTEIDYCEKIWKNSLEIKKKKDLWRWAELKLEKILQDGVDGKLDNDEQKALREQLLVHQFDTRRRTVLQLLKEWEEEINLTTKGMPMITVENEVDLAGPPPGFTYINDYIPGPGINIPDDPPMGCSCTDCFGNRKDCCAPQFNSTFAYSQHKRIRVPIGTPIYECNKKCACGPDCPNRVVQDGLMALKEIKLCIFRTSNGCGWGVKTLRSIKKGTFVSLYAGEVIGMDDADRRGREYDAEGCTYVFDLDFNEGDAFPYAVDAAKYGNVAHFFNHSCDPNLAVFAVWVNCLDPNLPRLALFAIKDISRGTQLAFDYKNQISNTNPEDGNKEMKLRQKVCLCGASNCRQVLFL